MFGVASEIAHKSGANSFALFEGFAKFARSRALDAGSTRAIKLFATRQTVRCAGHNVISESTRTGSNTTELGGHGKLFDNGSTQPTLSASRS